MKIRNAALLGLTLAAASGLRAAAQPSPAAPIDCAGGDASVTGDRRQVQITGACRSLTVRGNGNRVEAELAPRADLQVFGDGNSVRYRLIGGTEDARRRIAGVQNIVGPDAAPQAGVSAPACRAPLTLAQDSPAEADCTDRDVNVTADGGTFTLRGGCRSLTVASRGTTVHAEMQAQSRIAVSGDNDTVYWFLKTSEAEPIADVTGSSSRVLKEQRLGSVIAPPSAAPIDTGGQPPLTLGSSSQPVDERCGGRDADITADNTVFVLHDHCRTLSVTGNNDTVEVELVPGGRIKIVGDHTVVQFVLDGAGADPIVSTAGEGSTSYRIQRLGASSRATAGQGVTPTAGGMAVDGGKGASVVEMPAVPQPTTPQ